MSHVHLYPCRRCDQLATSHLITLLTLLVIMVAAVLARGETSRLDAARCCPPASIDAATIDPNTHDLE